MYFQGNGSGGQTIGHGLGGKIEFYIIKERGRSGDDWMCYHSYLGAGKKSKIKWHRCRRK